MFRDEVASLLLAIQFLTRIPIKSHTLFSPERMANSVHYYPLVGILIGAICAAIYALCQVVFPHVVSVLFAVASGILLTGAFHEDGLADTFDGVGGGVDRECSLEIMKDSRIGTYGTLALVMLVLIKLSALTHLPEYLIPATLIAGHCLSRLSSVLVISSSRYVREEGTGKPVSQGISTTGLVAACLTGASVIISMTIFVPPLSLLIAVAGLVAGHLAMRLLFEPKLGGYTGDTLGAVQQVSETGFYLGLLAWPYY